MQYSLKCRQNYGTIFTSEYIWQLRSGDIPVAYLGMVFKKLPGIILQHSQLYHTDLSLLNSGR